MRRFILTCGGLMMLAPFVAPFISGDADAFLIAAISFILGLFVVLMELLLGDRIDAIRDRNQQATNDAIEAFAGTPVGRRIEWFLWFAIVTPLMVVGWLFVGLRGWVFL